MQNSKSPDPESSKDTTRRTGQESPETRRTGQEFPEASIPDGKNNEHHSNSTPNDDMCYAKFTVNRQGGVSIEAFCNPEYGNKSVTQIAQMLQYVTEGKWDHAIKSVLLRADDEQGSRIVQRWAELTHSQDLERVCVTPRAVFGVLMPKRQA
jgi:hypothetical protein